MLLHNVILKLQHFTDIIARR